MTSIHPRPEMVATVAEKDILSIIEEGISPNEVAIAKVTESINATISAFSNDPELHRQYISSQRKYFDKLTLIPLVTVMYTTVVSRYNLIYINLGNPSFVIALGLLILINLIFIPYFVARIIVNYTPTTKRHCTNYQYSKEWLRLCYACKIEDVIGILTEVITGMYLLGRVYEGQCGADVNVWKTQCCNPVADLKSIPTDQVILLYLIPLVLQNVLRGISIQALVFCYILSLLFVILAIAHVGSLIEIWTIMHSLTFLILVLMGERSMRVTFIHGQAMLTVVQLNAKKEMELLELSTENDRKLKEKEFSQLRSLMGNVAHDLKTPLHSIEADLEVLRLYITKVSKSILDAVSANFIVGNDSCNSFHLDSVFESLSSTCKFMSMAINRSQDFMKASNNIALVPALETFDIVSILATSVSCMKHVQSARTIIAHPIDTAINSHLISDRHWLSENILCLLSNALKYSDDGDVDLRIKLVNEQASRPQTKQQECRQGRTVGMVERNHTSIDILDMPSVLSESNQMILVTVEDTGIGIREDARHNLFQPFKQAQRMAGGTGLGLYSLSKRVEALGGSNGVADRPDGKQGSMFWFTFPYRPDRSAYLDSLLSKSLVIPEIRRSTSQEDMRKATILLVDDSPSILRVVSRLLQMNGHIVKTASNGFIGLKILKDAYTNQEFDMILTDLQMPVMDGIEATKRYREFENENNNIQSVEIGPCAGAAAGSVSMMRRKLMIIGMSANNDAQSKQEALDAGMDFFLAKPFAYNDLRLILPKSRPLSMNK